MRPTDAHRPPASPPPTAAWPPGVGDYVRVRRDGALGEVVQVIDRRQRRRFFVAFFTRGARPSGSYRLDELQSPWPAEL
jgi:hypothetical protein